MKSETMTVDDIECPYCGRVFDGGEATNYDSTTRVETYTCHPVKN